MTVFDLARLGTDEDDEPGQATDRAYWISRGSQASVEVADRMLALVNEVSPGMTLKYNKHYIGLARDGIADNFLSFRARRDYLIAEFRIARSEEVTSMVEQSDLDAMPYEKHWGHYRARLTGADVTTQRGLPLDLIRRANGSPAPIED